MSVVNPSLATPSRSISHTVRLAPYLVETLCELARAVRDKTHAQTEISGLLFGTSDEELTTIEALRTFEDTGPRSDLARRERLDKAFETAMVQADEDAELAECRLVGWFSLRSSSGLLTSDVEFHNRHFKQADDLALVVWREADTQVIAELYARTENRLLSGSDYRWSSVRLSTELRRVSEPIDLAMRAKVTADSYLRAYRGAEESPKRDDWKNFASSAKRTVMSLIPRRQSPTMAGMDTGTLFRRTDSYAEPPARPATTGTEVSRVRDMSRLLEPSRAAEPYRAVRYAEGEVSGLPMVINTPKRRSTIPWLSTALVFITFSAITFAVLAVKGTESGNGKLAQILRVIFPSAELGLHVETQGDRLLLSWNRRNVAVASASDGVLQIFDGTLHREVKLDGGQVADGSVLYKPLSQDVTFRLEVHGADQNAAMGSIRVLDATGSTHETPVLDLSTPPAATTPKTASQAPPPSPLPVPDTARPAAKQTAQNADRGELTIYRNPASTRVVPVPVRNVADKPPAVNSNPAGQATKSAAPSVQPPAPSRSTEAEPTATSSQSAATQPPATGSTINGWDSSAPAPRLAPPPATTAPAESRAPIFVPPKPLLQVMPNTRSLAAGVISQTTRVEVAVRIDNAGHVLSAHVLNENGSTKAALSGAAIAAARQWTFQPATLQGEKVESEHTIVFEFRPEAQQ